MRLNDWIAGGVVGSQFVAAAAIPTLTSTFGTVVAGSGTMIPVGVSVVQSFAAVSTAAAICSPIGLAVLAAGAIAGGAVAVTGAVVYVSTRD